MTRESLNNYDIIPEDMLNYLRYYGRHFNKKLCEFATSKMKVTNPSTGELEKLKVISKETIDSLLESYRIKVNNNQLYDYVFVANMCKADFLGDSVPDEFFGILHFLENIVLTEKSCPHKVRIVYFS